MIIPSLVTQGLAVQKISSGQSLDAQAVNWTHRRSDSNIFITHIPPPPPPIHNSQKQNPHTHKSIPTKTVMPTSTSLKFPNGAFEAVLILEMVNTTR